MRRAFVETPSPRTRWAPRASARAARSARRAAIANAVADALGGCHVDPPFTAEKLWEALPVKPPPFEYVAPRSLDEALALLAEHGDEAKVLAGGQSLVPLLNFRLARPALLVDLNRVAELAVLCARRAARCGSAR